MRHVSWKVARHGDVAVLEGSADGGNAVHCSSPEPGSGGLRFAGHEADYEANYINARRRLEAPPRSTDVALRSAKQRF